MVQTCIVHCVLTFWFWKETVTQEEIAIQGGGGGGKEGGLVIQGDEGREIVMR